LRDCIDGLVWPGGVSVIEVKKVASYFIDKSSVLDENNDLTNLKLQKMLYYAQVEYIKSNGEKLFDDDIEAWQYGPVVRSVYEWLKECGAYTITSFDIPIDMEGLTGEIESFLDKIWRKYNKYSAWYLVEATHNPKSAWSVVYKGGQGDHMVIPYDALRTTDTLN
jgi:uncharacterized phage-associated protein